jgi:hypothetical protein
MIMNKLPAIHAPTSQQATYRVGITPREILPHGGGSGSTRLVGAGFMVQDAVGNFFEREY